MPAQSSVFKGLIEHADFAKKYVHARTAQADVLFDEMLHIADTPVAGLKTVRPDGSRRCDLHRRRPREGAGGFHGEDGEAGRGLDRNDPLIKDVPAPPRDPRLLARLRGFASDRARERS
jgi:hypothetical protein